ncbi:hypothetical protein CPB83DRAFT_854888 [Crepidotus variabilis]|uniref:Essential protein Yae1 N-terminal domain-containing protein n=1 Tax=Crepidotus variabilis TaxID=179855 RepID=A0A9P6JPE8_9AGAR|nr:hypothetical protein CPB83DRAFT_854888 [Crepidotus variabilis]
MAGEFDLESLVHVEQTFYDTGFKDGFAHGRIHGLIEGRALGREKGFEMWEELGFYEGFAKTWRSMLLGSPQRQGSERIAQHINHLLELISKFPRTNPSSTSVTGDAGEELDISKLQRQIRSRYKVLCSCIGVRPRLQAISEGAGTNEEVDEIDQSGMDIDANITAGGSSIPVWKIDKATGRRSAVTNQDLNY